MNYYVPIKHPITGDRLASIPTGKTRQTESTIPEVEAEVRIITPRAGVETIWIRKSDIHTPTITQ